LVVQTAETGVVGAARAYPENPTKMRAYKRPAGGAEPVSKNV
jgi:hypothetical protein